MTEQKQPVSLASLLTPSKTVTVDYPTLPGFSIDLCYLAREELIKLRSRCVSQKLNRKTRAFEETLDEYFVEEITPVEEDVSIFEEELLIEEEIKQIEKEKRDLNSKTPIAVKVSPDINDKEIMKISRTKTLVALRRSFQ